MTTFPRLSDQRSNPEFQSAIVRLLIWLFLFVYIGLGAATEYYQVRMEQYYILFSTFLVIFIGLFISVLLRPVWLQRQYLALAIDVAATSFSIFLTQDALNPVFLFYIWIFVSYGTRYGKTHLLAATLMSLFAFTLVMTVLNGWEEHAFEAYFFLFILIILPIYQYSLLKKLHHARQQAEEANRARGRFLANMSHELRTPLSGVIGMAKIMDGSNLSVTQQKQLDAIKVSAEKLHGLIGDILDFSRIDAEKLELNLQPFDVRTTVMDVCTNLNVKAQEKGLKLQCDIHDEVPETMLGDALRISQVLINLVGNAIKFTDQGRVRVMVLNHEASEDCDVPHLLFEVSDTGIGIAKEQLGKIFDPFQQVDDSTTRRFGGTGLGTAISKKLVGLMGGSISVSSKPGQGSVFTICLPLPEFADAETVMENDPLITETAKPGLNILVVEDDPVSAQLMTFLLQDRQHKVTLVEDGIAALQEVRSGRYDMAFVDLHMPQMDGVEFTRHLRKGALKVRNIPVFALTANASQEARQSCLQAGVNEFMIKPVTAETLDQLMLQYA